MKASPTTVSLDSSMSDFHSDFVDSFLSPAPLAPWRSPLARSLHRNRSRPYSRYAQLATVQPNGRPANRTVVFRGFWGDRNILQFVTDQRSQKVTDLAHCPWTELCWYFTQTREQFRLAGPTLLVTAQHPNPDLQAARHQSWEALSDGGKTSFFWPTPGDSRQPDLEADVPETLPPVPPETFCLGLLHPEWVDHLELRGDPQNRTRYDLVDGQWQITAMNP